METPTSPHRAADDTPSCSADAPDTRRESAAGLSADTCRRCSRMRGLCDGYCCSTLLNRFNTHLQCKMLRSKIKTVQTVLGHESAGIIFLSLNISRGRRYSSLPPIHTAGLTTDIHTCQNHCSSKLWLFNNAHYHYPSKNSIPRSQARLLLGPEKTVHRFVP